MNIFNEFTDLLPKFEKLPTRVKDNLTKSGKKKPMSLFVASALYNKPLDINTFQKQARMYYKTSKVGSKLWLVNEINGNFCIINFEVDLFQYMTIEFYVKNKFLAKFQTLQPRFNSDLFKTIVKRKLV